MSSCIEKLIENHVCLVVHTNLVIESHLEEETSLEKLPPSDWAIGMSIVAFS